MQSCKCIFRRHDVSLDLKLRLFNSYVLSQFSHTEVSHGVSPNTWRIGLMPVKIAGSEELCGLRIKTASQMKRSANRYQCPTEQTDAIKMVRACVMDSQHTDQKCTSNREKIKRTTEEKMDGLY